MKIAIQGHPTRGNEVIQILESLGGKNIENLNGFFINHYYCIDLDGVIRCTKYSSKNMSLYSLEKFEEKFPFKIGDKVFLGENNERFYTIKSMRIWYDGCIVYELTENGFYYAADKLTLYKEMQERNITLTLDKAKEWYKKGDELKEIALQAYSKKELTKVELPKTWDEFCENHPTENGENYINDCSSIDWVISEKRRLSDQDRNILPSFKAAKAHLALMQLHQLRDCYRQGWVPDFTDDTLKHVICLISGIPVVTTIYGTSNFLSFQTKKLAEEFLNNFKDLIIEAGDLI